MANPQQPELARSRKTPSLNPDAATAHIETRGDLPGAGTTGPVPAENQPGHHPEKDQDKPDLDKFAERMGITEPTTQPQPRSQPTAPGRLAAVAGGRARWFALAPLVLFVGLVVRRSRRRRSR